MTTQPSGTAHVPTSRAHGHIQSQGGPVCPVKPLGAHTGVQSHDAQDVRPVEPLGVRGHVQSHEAQHVGTSPPLGAGEHIQSQQEEPVGPVPATRARTGVQSQPERNWWPRKGQLSEAVQEWLRIGFGAAVQKLRKDRGWTQADLAKRIGCCRDTVSRLERGRHRPTRQQIAWLARVLSPDGYPPLLLDLDLCGLAGVHMRPSRRRSKRADLLYRLPSEWEAEFERAKARAARALDLSREVPPDR